jgi:hypothetical protein
MATMGDDRKRLAPSTSRHLPVTSPATTPSGGLPSLPVSSGKVWGSRTAIMEADARFVRAHGDYLQARTEQTQQMKMLVDARIGLALKIAELGVLPELAKHEYEKGRRDRAHDVAMQELTHQTTEVNARINLVRAQESLGDHMAALEPTPAEPIPPPSPVAARGLTAAQAVAAVNEIAMHLPEMTPEAREHLVLLLSGYFSEKSK